MKFIFIKFFRSVRLIWLSSFLLTVFLLIFSFWLQAHDGMIPCLLCLLQRFVFVILAVIFLLGILGSSRLFHKTTALLAFLAASAGVFFAGRQVWLQHLPAGEQADCGVSLHYLMEILPWDQVVTRVLQGSAECSRVTWQFLHLSLAEWSLIFFVFFAVISLVQFIRLYSCKKDEINKNKK